MKEFIEKLIERLEEQAEQYRRRGFEHEQKGYSAMADKYYGKQCSYLHSIEIVNELAEEYKDNDYWKIIYNKVCELEKKYANDGNTESVNDCIKLENLLQYFKEELRSEEEYINTSTDTSSGWIPCSERLPEEDGYYLTTIRFYHLHNLVAMGCNFEDGKWLYMDGDDEVLAWMPLPAPYKEGE